MNRPITTSEFNDWAIRKRNLPSSFLNYIMEFTTTLIVHSKLAQRILQEQFDVRCVYVPFAAQHGVAPSALTKEARLKAKLRCGINPYRIALGTFGSVHPVKGDIHYPFILRHLLDRGLDIDFYYVGPVSDNRRNEIVSAATDMNVVDHLHFAIDISDKSYIDHLVAMDIGVQTRSILGGQVSGALMDCVETCLPTIASTGLVDSIEAPNSIVHAINDISSPVQIAHEIANFIPYAQEMARPNPAWQSFIEDRSFTKYVKRLEEALFS